MRDRIPSVRTRLKYDVTVHVPEEVLEGMPRADDILSKDVESPTQGILDNVSEQIGDVILATNGLSRPSRASVIDSQMEESSSRNTLPENHIGVVWTYIISSAGSRRHAEVSTDTEKVSDMHRVLIEEDNTPLEGAEAITQFDPGPIEVSKVRISTS